MKKPDKIIGYDEYGPMAAPRWYESLFFHSFPFIVIALVVYIVFFS